MVFVTVGQDNSVNAIGSLLQPREVRQDEVDTVHRWLREHQAGVNDEQSAILFDDHAVPADFAETTKEVNLDGGLSHAGQAENSQSSWLVA